MNMGSRFELQIAPFPIGVSSERTLDISRLHVVTFNEAAVMGVHDAHERGEIGRRARMQCPAWPTPQQVRPRDR
jgi:hypothetical protein